MTGAIWFFGIVGVLLLAFGIACLSDLSYQVMRIADALEKEQEGRREEDTLP